MPAITRMGRLVALPLVLAALLATTLFATAGSASAMTRTQRVGNGLDIAAAQKGDWYRYGAAGPNRFDCSGLTYFAFRKAGFSRFPRTSSGQAAAVRRIHRSHMRKGDLVFFYSGSARARNVYHVGIFTGWHHGHRLILHAPRSGERVHRERIWTNSWFPGTLR